MGNQQVMFDSDLAELYGVETRVLNQAVKRDKKRFLLKFMFQLTEKRIKYFKKYLGVTKCDTQI